MNFVHKGAQQHCRFLIFDYFIIIINMTINIINVILISGWYEIVRIILLQNVLKFMLRVERNKDNIYSTPMSNDY